MTGRLATWKAWRWLNVHPATPPAICTLPQKEVEAEKQLLAAAKSQSKEAQKQAGLLSSCLRYPHAACCYARERRQPGWCLLGSCGLGAACLERTEKNFFCPALPRRGVCGIPYALLPRLPYAAAGGAGRDAAPAGRPGGLQGGGHQERGGAAGACLINLAQISPSAWAYVLHRIQHPRPCAHSGCFIYAGGRCKFAGQAGQGARGGAAPAVGAGGRQGGR